MNLLKHAIKSPFTVAPFKPNYVLSFRQSANHFSTGAEQPPPPQDSSFQPFLRNSGPGIVYAKLSGITKHTLKTDIINLMEGCNLTPDDIKVVYDRSFMPRGMMVRFSSGAAYDAAVRASGKNGRLYRLDMADPSSWDHIVSFDGRKVAGSQLDTTYDGKTILLQGIPQNAQVEDVDRFLSGCSYDSTATQLFQRGEEKAALVRFHSRTETMNALITKNHNFCLNGQISIRLLQ